MSLRRRIHPRLIAFAAVAGMLLAAAEPCTAGSRSCGTAESRMLCCVGDAVNADGCCTYSAAEAPRSGPVELTAPDHCGSSSAACVPAACECRASDDAVPNSKGDHRLADGPSDTGAYLPATWRAPTLPSAPMALAALQLEERLRRPLYLLTTHLLF